MDFGYSPEQKDLIKTISDFARKELNEDIETRDHEGAFSRSGWQKCAQMQLMALPFPEEYGGCGLDFLTTAITFEALATGCRDGGLVHAIGTQLLCGIQIQQFGSEDQKRRFLPGICGGEIIAAQAITEPDAGSDPMSMKTRARKTDDGWVLNGCKSFITNAPIADLAIIFAVTDPERPALGRISVFLVETDSGGVSRSRPMEKLGLRTLQNGEIYLEDCRVSESGILGKEGQGVIIFNESMEWERSLLPAAQTGALEHIIETCANYANTRKAFGQAIGQFQAVSHRISQMKVNLEVGRLALYRAAWMKSMGKHAVLESSAAKLFISEIFKSACLDAVQVLGGYGYSKEYGLERDLRDSVAGTIFSGTSEIQLNIISKLLGL
jgi:alkylation response protein AidB-like acyl-CoA dehydrogenase